MSIDPAKAVELYAAVHLTVIGLLHVLQPAAWARFFELLRSHGASGAFANGFLSLMFGSIIVAFHNIWEGGAIVLTLLGWAQIVKALVAFTAPEFSLRGMNRVSPDRLWEFQFAGAVFLAIAAWLAFRLSQAT
jgi:hypothetical protein